MLIINNVTYLFEICIQKSVGNITLPYAMPTKVDFDSMDGLGDGDGVLTMVEWYNFVGCSED